MGPNPSMDEYPNETKMAGNIGQMKEDYDRRMDEIRQEGHGPSFPERITMYLVEKFKNVKGLIPTGLGAAAGLMFGVPATTIALSTGAGFLLRNIMSNKKGPQKVAEPTQA